MTSRLRGGHRWWAVALAEAGVVPDLVVGSSVGALIGEFWAAGYSEDQLEAVAFSGGPLTLFDFSIFADRGWIHGQRLQDFVRQRLGPVGIEQLPRRFLAVATRLNDKAPVYFDHGDISWAVRAAHQAGATFVIAVDLIPGPEAAPDWVPQAWLTRAAQRRARIDPELARADVVIRPDTGYFARPTPGFFRMAHPAGATEPGHTALSPV